MHGPARPSAPAASAPAAHAPDYGGRDAPLVPSDTGTAMPNPLAQAGRALEALLIVLVGIVGVMYLLKRAGVSGGAPASPGAGAVGKSHFGLKSLFQTQVKTPTQSTPPRADSNIALAVVQSQILPGAGGATVHLLTVGGKAMLLVGATPQSVSLLAEWEQDALKPGAEEARAEQAAFDEYLTRAGVAPAPGPARAAEDRIAVTADRLQDLLSRSRKQSPEELPK